MYGVLLDGLGSITSYLIWPLEWAEPSFSVYIFLYVFNVFLSFHLSFLPFPALILECTPGLGPDPGVDPCAQPGSIRWTENQKEWALIQGCFGWRDSQTDQWDQGSWLRCCWDGWRCVLRRSMWCLVKLGMDRTKLTASPALWTRERCNGFDAVARRHWEGKDENSLCVNPLCFF